jgi:hypothetical protein
MSAYSGYTFVISEQQILTPSSSVSWDSSIEIWLCREDISERFDGFVDDTTDRTSWEAVVACDISSTKANHLSVLKESPCI